MRQLLYTLLLIFCFTVFSCHDNPVGAENADMQLSAVDVGVTDILLRVRVAQSNKSRVLTLKRDGQILLTSHYFGLDTTLLDTSLLPNHSYKYTANLVDYSTSWSSNVELSLTTMDTTSHDFIWHIDTLGDGGSSSLRDVAIVNDTCVFVVGEIHVRDSSGNWDPNFYNVGEWNGSRWKLHAFLFPLYNYDCTVAGYTPVQVNTISAFGPKKVLLNGVALWNGDSLEHLPCIPPSILVRRGEITKTWGTSENDFFVVGTKGMILHFAHGSWSWMESGTDVDLLDVWGSPDGKVVWTCGYYSSSYGTYLFRNGGSGWSLIYDGTAHEFEIHDDSLSGAYSTLYTSRSNVVYVGASAGVYRTTQDAGGAARRLSFTPTFFPGFPNRLRGNDANDLIVVGFYNMIAHYNGSSWLYYQQFYNQDEHLFSVDVKRNLLVAVGEIYDPIDRKGLVIIGRR